jgi:SAM-dependent methyltransferase
MSEPHDGAVSEAESPPAVPLEALADAPRPSSPGRKPTLPGVTVSEPPPPPSFDDAAATVRQPPVTDEPTEGPPEIQRFLSPPPPPPRTETPSGGAEGSGTRRRSRRTVKIPDDAVPQKTPAPPAVEAVAAPVSDRLSPAPPPPVSERPAQAVAPPPASDKPALVVPPPPPVPVLSPRTVPRPQKPLAAEEHPKPAVEEPARAAETAPAPPAVEAFEVIRPMRIISIGSQPPPAESAVPAAAPAPPPAPPPPKEAARPAVASAVDDAAWEESPRHPSRPPMMASPELEGFAAPPPPAVPSSSTTPTPPAPPVSTPPKPKPPKVEEVEAEAISEDEPDAHGSAPTLRTEEIESIPDDEIVAADRISETSLAAPADEIPVDVVEAAPQKKPPPPPPKRVSADGSPASAPMSAPAEAKAPPPPPPASAPPASAPADAKAPSGPPQAPTLDLGGRKRQKPWWEEIFSDDYLRTMEKIEPKVVRKECDFIEDRLGLEKGAVMLDLACGAGLHAVELSSRGYNVVGYDLSLAMLARAQDEALDRGQRINFLQGDMREMAFEEAFDGVYCWNTSFGYFDDEKNLNVLSRIRRTLRQGGLFLLDVANRDYICPRQPSLVWFEGDGCVCMDEMHVDFFSSRLRVKRTVMFEDGRSREVDYGIRLYALHELGKMLHETGFKVVEVTGHPAHPGVFFGSESPRIIVLAERA